MENPIFVFLAIWILIAVVVFKNGQSKLQAVTAGLLVSGLLVGTVHYVFHVDETNYSDKPELFLYSYRKTENASGTQFYYFDDQHQPPIDPNYPVPGTEEALRQAVLPAVNREPDRESSRLLTWDNYEGGRLVVQIEKCTRGDGNCISKITFAPSQGQRTQRATETKRSIQEQPRPVTTKSGYVACIEKEWLQDIIKFTAADDRRNFEAYLTDRKCFLLEEGKTVTVTEWPGLFGGTVGFVFEGQKFWSVREALDYGS